MENNKSKSNAISFPNSESPIPNSSKGVVLKLSLKDLKHEWILTSCLVMAIAAVLAPLLLLFGLKYGIITWGREYLTQDPLYREIRPMTSKSFNKEWFEQMEKRDDVAFVMPMTRQIAATVKAHVKGKKKKEELNIIPTRAQDPLVLENGAAIPSKKECVLTRIAAEDLQAKVGDTIVARAGRIIGGKYEYGALELKVSGILSVRASELNSMYVRLPILEAVERYKDGQAAPEFGWSGTTPKAYPLYDGLIISLPKKLGKVGEFSLCNRTGFTKIESLNNEQLLAKAGFQVAPEMAVYRLYTLRKPAGEESVTSVKNKLRGKNAHLFPWVAPIKAQLLNSSGEEAAALSLASLSADSAQALATGLSPIPPWGKLQRPTSEILKIMLPADMSIQGENFLLKVDREDGTLSFPVTIMSERAASGNIAFIPAELAGILKLYKSRNIKFDDNLKEFVLFRRGYAGFRMYAKNIFDVDGLRRFFAEKSLPVHTEIKEIKKVIELDRGMTLIFWLLAFVGITGSIASLIASLYASVERKKREMSVLRLIGLSGPKLFRFPIYQGIFIGSGGFILSTVLFGIFSSLINSQFRPYVDKLLGFPMEAGVSFCRIPFFHMLTALTGTVIIAAVAAMVAAMRVTQYDPAEALRDE